MTYTIVVLFQPNCHLIPSPLVRLILEHQGLPPVSSSMLISPTQDDFLYGLGLCKVPGRPMGPRYWSVRYMKAQKTNPFLSGADGIRISKEGGNRTVRVEGFLPLDCRITRPSEEVIARLTAESDCTLSRCPGEFQAEESLSCEVLDDCPGHGNFIISISRRRSQCELCEITQGIAVNIRIRAGDEGIIEFRRGKEGSSPGGEAHLPARGSTRGT